MIARERTIRKTDARSAFTLMEMLVVVSIIVMLAGLGGFYFINAQRTSQKKAAEVQIRVIIQACEAFAINNNFYPQQLTDLLDNGQQFQGAPYLKSIDNILVPWSTHDLQIPYQYVAPNDGNPIPYVWTEYYGQVIGHPPQ